MVYTVHLWKHKMLLAVVGHQRPVSDAEWKAGTLPGEPRTLGNIYSDVHKSVETVTQEQWEFMPCVIQATETMAGPVQGADDHSALLWGPLTNRMNPSFAPRQKWGRKPQSTVQGPGDAQPREGRPGSRHGSWVSHGLSKVETDKSLRPRGLRTCQVPLHLLRTAWGPHLPSLGQWWPRHHTYSKLSSRKKSLNNRVQTMELQRARHNLATEQQQNNGVWRRVLYPGRGETRMSGWE